MEPFCTSYCIQMSYRSRQRNGLRPHGLMRTIAGGLADGACMTRICSHHIADTRLQAVVLCMYGVRSTKYVSPRRCGFFGLERRKCGTTAFALGDEHFQFLFRQLGSRAVVVPMCEEREDANLSRQWPVNLFSSSTLKKMSGS
jgi:hypothetical protein